MSRVAWLVLLCGCITDNRSHRDRGASGLWENAPTVKAPKTGRCDRFSGKSNAGKACADAKYLGEVYVRKLASGDRVCIEGGFGEDDSDCKARASVADSAPNKVLIEVRDAKPDSKYFGKESQLWFEEGALVDLYLADHGF